jgi:hypothetical protein
MLPAASCSHLDLSEVPHAHAFAGFPQWEDIEGSEFLISFLGGSDNEFRVIHNKSNKSLLSDFHGLVELRDHLNTVFDFITSHGYAQANKD